MKRKKNMVVNPAWLATPFEYGARLNTDSQAGDGDHPVWPADDYAPRFYLKDGKYVEVPAFIEA